ncbi:hypothetical protein PS918_04912 [Pseudomonas fluorescens]|uniref:Uncharacterized protein n=1 Tax=Pseudomonas fluorescens TaxID=294 RepID=A0A5E7UDG4_PSEFL|nr:hypothetical protein PS918_04912 [Pseudomonas fluorescens]
MIDLYTAATPNGRIANTAVFDDASVVKDAQTMLIR